MSLFSREQCKLYLDYISFYEVNSAKFTFSEVSRVNFSMVVVMRLRKLFFLLQIIMKLVLNGLNENYKVIWILELMQDSQKEPSLKKRVFSKPF